jgi:hypothetical protein
MVVPGNNASAIDVNEEDWRMAPPPMHHGTPINDTSPFSFDEDPRGRVPSVLPVVEKLPVEEEPPPPINHANEFIRIQKSRKGWTFPYRCYGCDTVIELRQRVTQTKRVCPGCGKPITIAGIDSQVETLTPRERPRPYDGNTGCVIAFIFIRRIVDCRRRDGFGID